MNFVDLSDLAQRRAVAKVSRVDKKFYELPLQTKEFYLKFLFFEFGFNRIKFCELKFQVFTTEILIYTIYIQTIRISHEL